MNGIYIMMFCVWLMGCLLQDLSAMPTKKKGCLYDGKLFRVNELVTGNTCDECYCTPWGIMCQLKYCPPANCLNKVRRECCWECPDNTCHYAGEHGSVIVPETGCRYRNGSVCHCYHGNNGVNSVGETICYPAFQEWSLPKCNATIS